MSQVVSGSFYTSAAETLLKLREKPPHFCEDLFSLERDTGTEPAIITVRS